MNQYLVCYDIADPRRLQRVHRICKHHGIALQYSVFLFEGNRARVDALIAKLKEVIHEVEDDIRIYPLKNGANGIMIGVSPLPGDAWLIVEDERFDILVYGKDTPDEPPI